MPRLFPLAAATTLLLSAACRPQATATGTAGEKAAPSPQVPTPALDAIELEKRADGLFYRTGENRPFTGTDIEPDRVKAEQQGRPGFVMVTPYKEGRIDGTLRVFYPRDKGLQEERVYQAGEAIQSTVYYPGGAKKIFAELNAKDVAEGKYLRWHANGKLETEGAHDADERFHGESKEYQETGTLKAHYEWEHGKLVKIHFESPGQTKERLEKYGEFPAKP